MPIPILGGMLASSFVGKLKGVPWQVWAALGLVVAIGVGSCVHGRKVDQLRKESYAAGAAAEKKSWEKRLDKVHAEALAWKRKAEVRAAQISQDIRGKHEATLRDNGARADGLRLRGPGAARCGSGDNPGVPTTTGGREPAGGRSDAPAGGVPAEAGNAVVPWGWLVDRAEQCDANRSEVLGWRQWHQRQSAIVDIAPTR